MGVLDITRAASALAEVLREFWIEILQRCVARRLRLQRRA